MVKTYDIAVIGSGPGGYVAAIRAAQLGLKAVCVEKGALGGTCLNRGCIPTKALLEASHMVSAAKHAAGLGVEFAQPVINFPKMVERKDGVVAVLDRGIAQLFKKNKIAHVAGVAKLAGKDQIDVTTTTGEKSQVQAKKIIIATGSEPLNIPAFAFDGELVLSSTDVLNLKNLPKSLLILGGGYIGCEFACFFAELGVRVIVVEMLERVLPLGDPDVSGEIATALEALKVELHTGTMLEKLEKAKGKVIGTLRIADCGLQNTSPRRHGEHGEKECCSPPCPPCLCDESSIRNAKSEIQRTVEAEKAVICVGRKLNSDGIGLEAAGVKLGQKKEILVNEHCQTNVPNIYAIGDVTGRMLLAHLASRMGNVAAEHAAGRNSKIDYSVVPACVFTHPETASVGLTQAEATARGIEAKVFRFPVQVLGRALAADELGGFVKLVGDAKTGQLLGAHIVCSRAGDLITEAALAIQMEATVQEIAHTIHTHPTLGEGMMEAAEGWLGKGIYAPASSPQA